MKKRILITGGAGFIGYHLAQHLSQDEQNEVTLLDDFSRGKQDKDLQALLLKPNLRMVSGDLTDRQTLNRLPAGFDEVYHLAAILGVRNVIERPHEVLRVNLVSLLNILEWVTAGGGKRLLFSSTSEAYAWTQQFHPLPIPTPEDVPLALTDLKSPRSTYAGSKMVGELAVTQYCQVAGLPFVIVRYHNVYGPRMGREHVIPQLYQRACAGENPLVVYSASHRRAFCYVEDAVEATIRAMRTEAAAGMTINIGNDKEETTIGELAARILHKAGRPVLTENRENKDDPIDRRCPNINRARHLLGYEPVVTLDRGLELTMAWYAESFRQDA